MAGMQKAHLQQRHSSQGGHGTLQKANNGLNGGNSLQGLNSQRKSLQVVGDQITQHFKGATQSEAGASGYMSVWAVETLLTE